jgi:hypothetical protein
MRLVNLTGRQVSRAQHRTGAQPRQGTPRRTRRCPALGGAPSSNDEMELSDQLAVKMSYFSVMIPFGQHLNVPGFVGLTRT